jgi:hypothetical protein
MHQVSYVWEYMLTARGVEISAMPASAVLASEPAHELMLCDLCTSSCFVNCAYALTQRRPDSDLDLGDCFIYKVWQAKGTKSPHVE